MNWKTLLAIVLANTVNVSHGGEIGTTNVVTAVTQDENYTYLATHDGVYLYDGANELNLSKVIPDLPSGWVSDVALSGKSDLYVAYNGDGLWLADLQLRSASKISDQWIKKISAFGNGNKLLAIDNESVYTIDGVKISKLDIRDKPLGVDGIEGSNGYILTSNGVATINQDKLVYLHTMDITAGDIVATPYGVVYTSGDVMYSYSLDGRKAQSKLDYNVKALAFGYPHSIYYLSDGKIGATDLALSYTDYVYNQDRRTYSELYVGPSDIWAISALGVDTWPRNETLKALPKTSKYNVINYADNILWLGTKTGVYQMQGSTYKAVDWINSQLPKGITITSINWFNGALVLSTSNGAFVVNQNTQKITMIYDKYVVNASVINDYLHFATDKHGVISFTHNFKKVDYITNLPSNETLSVDLAFGNVFVSTANGMLDTGTGKHHLPGKLVSAVAEHNGSLYAATYGDGIYKLQNDNWVRILSPDHVTDLVTSKGLMYVTANSGVYTLVANDKINVLNNSQSYRYIPNSLAVLGDTVLAVSAHGLLQKTVNKGQVEYKVSYALTSKGVDINVGQVINVDLQDTSWVTLALSTKKTGDTNLDLDYRYRIDGDDWHVISQPILSLNNLVQGTKKIEFEVRQYGVWGMRKQIDLIVTGPWYSATWCYVVIIALLSLLGIYLSVRAYQWLQSFHRIFKAAFRDDKQDAQEALKLITDSAVLCSGNEIELTEGLLKIHLAIDKLIPLAHSNAVLGDKNLEDGLTLIKANCIANHLNTQFEFDVTLGSNTIKKDISSDIYAIVYHVVNCLLKSQCASMNVYINKLVESFNVSVNCNGKITSQPDIELAKYLTKQIGKKYSARPKWSQSRDHVKFDVSIPIKKHANLRLVG